MKNNKTKEFREQIENEFELRKMISELKTNLYNKADCGKCSHRAVCNMLGGYEELRKRFNAVTFKGVTVESFEDARDAMWNGRCIYFN